MLKPYYLKIMAIKITKRNYKELQELDFGDGSLDTENKNENIGDWFVFINGGYEVWPGNVELIST